jgi:hypothetical protein
VESNGIHQLLFYAGNVNLLSENINIIKRPYYTDKKVGLVVNIETTKNTSI